MKKLSSMYCHVFIMCILSCEAQTAIFSKRKLILRRGLRLDNCSPSPQDDPVKIRDLEVFTTIDGDLDVSGLALISLVLNSSVKAVVSVQRQVTGRLWVPVPCVQGLGSCTYDDLCQFTLEDDVECPPLFQENDVPCHCPVQPGKYHFPGGQFVLPSTRWAGVMTGTYQAKVLLSQNGNHLGCYKATFKLE